MGRGESRRDVPDLTGEDTAPVDAACRGLRLDCGALRTVAEEERGRVEASRDEPCEDFNDDVLPLEPVERAGMHEPNGRRRGCGVLEEGLVRKAVGNDDDLRRRYARPFEGLRGGARDGEVARRRAVLEARERVAARRENDAAVDDERRDRGGEAEDGGAVAARVPCVHDLGVEGPRLVRYGEEKGRGRLGARRHLDDGKAPGPRGPGERRTASGEKADFVPPRGEAGKEEHGLLLPSTHRGAKVEREQPHGRAG